MIVCNQTQMTSRLKSFFFMAGWRFPLLRALSSLRPVILIYHGVPAESDGTSINAELFDRHVEFLKTHFELIPPGKLAEKRRATDKIRVLLTFDDGFRNNAEVVAPILRRHEAPATFFVCSRHATSGKYLWFSYLRALEKHFPGDGLHFRGRFLDMSPSHRTSTVRRLWATLLNLTPHPGAMYNAIERELPRLEDFVASRELANNYAGMTADQVRSLAADRLFSVGAHTVDHPFLTKSEPQEAFRQISENKKWIEQLTNRECDAIAYPSGDYDGQVLEQCRQLGFTYGYAQTPKLVVNRNLELSRPGIYSPALDIVGFKVQWGDFIRRLRLQIG